MERSSGRALLLSRLCGDLPGARINPSDLRNPLVICWKPTPAARFHTGCRYIKQTVNGSAVNDVWRRNVDSFQVEPRLQAIMPSFTPLDAASNRCGLIAHDAEEKI